MGELTENKPGSEWDDALDAVFAAIATTPKSLESICKEIESAPSARTVYRMIEADEVLCQRYARAKEAQLQVLADQLVDLADSPVEARKTVIKADGSEEITIGDAVERTKVQIDVRKWLLSKLAPKKYGDKVEQYISGPEGGPLKASISIELVRPNGDNSTS